MKFIKCYILLRGIICLGKPGPRSGKRTPRTILMNRLPREPPPPTVYKKKRMRITERKISRERESETDEVKTRYGEARWVAHSYRASATESKQEKNFSRTARA